MFRYMGTSLGEFSWKNGLHYPEKVKRFTSRNKEDQRVPIIFLIMLKQGFTQNVKMSTCQNTTSDVTRIGSKWSPKYCSKYRPARFLDRPVSAPFSHLWMFNFGTENERGHDEGKPSGALRFLFISSRPFAHYWIPLITAFNSWKRHSRGPERFFFSTAMP